MSLLVPDGAALQCSMGSSPGTLKVLPTNLSNASSAPLATVQDYVPMMNIQPFGMCKSMSNPQVASATAAAQGVLTPQPCVPVTTSPWSPANSGIQINKLPALLDNGTCNCTWGGTIQVQQAGQQVVKAQSGSSQRSTTTPAAINTPPSVQRPSTHHVAHHFVCGVTGKPVANLSWQLRSSSGDLIASGKTGDDGFVVAPVPQPGTHSIEFNQDDNDNGSTSQPTSSGSTSSNGSTPPQPSDDDPDFDPITASEQVDCSSDGSSDASNGSGAAPTDGSGDGSGGGSANSSPPPAPTSQPTSTAS